MLPSLSSRATSRNGASGRIGLGAQRRVVAVAETARGAPPKLYKLLAHADVWEPALDATVTSGTGPRSRN